MKVLSVLCIFVASMLTASLCTCKYLLRCVVLHSCVKLAAIEDAVNCTIEVNCTIFQEGNFMSWRKLTILDSTFLFDFY